MEVVKDDGVREPIKILKPFSVLWEDFNHTLDAGCARRLYRHSPDIRMG
jgi:hypothetical protein